MPAKKSSPEKGQVRTRSPTKRSGSRSPGRPKSPSRKKSPARMPKSPATPGRPKSPGRTRSPGRPKSSPEKSKSPGRPRVTREKSKSPGRERSLTDKSKSPGRGRSEKSKSPGRPQLSSEENRFNEGRRSPGRPKSPSRKAEKSPVYAKISSWKELSPSRMRKSPSRSSKSYGLDTYLEKKALMQDLSDQIVQVQKENAVSQAMMEEPRKLTKEDADQISFGIRSRRTKLSSTASVSSMAVTSSGTRSSARLAAKEEDITGEKADSKHQKETSVERRTSSERQTEFGGWPGSLALILLFPSTILGLHLACSKDSCTVIKLPAIPRNWQSYFDLEAAGLYLVFVFMQTVLSVLPIGRVVDGQPGLQGRLRYRLNGIASLLITAAALGSLIYYKQPVTVLYTKYIQFLVTAMCLGLLLSVLLYVLGRRAPVSALNPAGNTGNVIVDFFMGREVNPRWGSLDIKITLFRTAMIGLVVMNVALILKDIENSAGHWSPTLTMAAAFQIFYALDSLWFEETFLTTFEIMYEGVGYMLSMGYAIYPFMPTLITRYLVDHKIEQPIVLLLPCMLLNVIGFIIYRSSNSQKNEFRKNPLNPALAHLETIPTARGKKLLVSGWWGWVRHPNYLGDILMHWSWSLPCGFSHVLPHLLPFATTTLLVHRAARDDRRCQSRYGAAWERYVSHVRSRIIPKVY